MDTTAMLTLLEELVNKGSTLSPDSGNAYGYIIIMFIAVVVLLIAGGGGIFMMVKKMIGVLYADYKEARAEENKQKEKFSNDLKGEIENLNKGLQASVGKITETLNGHDKRIEKNSWVIEQLRRHVETGWAPDPGEKNKES